MPTNRQLSKIWLGARLLRVFLLLRSRNNERTPKLDYRLRWKTTGANKLSSVKNIRSYKLRTLRCLTLSVGLKWSSASNLKLWRDWLSNELSPKLRNVKKMRLELSIFWGCRRNFKKLRSEPDKRSCKEFTMNMPPKLELSMMGIVETERRTCSSTSSS
ncbi:hypothetical protein PF005_g28530 [Phytophthora fragariae]|uniref:Uncharacterized protein n=1 Tax=Phytophthora fragariae TaxID=53985 RepID=A0A6A3DP77_9STRA|nr:hypothetical protein PF003_g28170 [Phytophthora fragariae]KAE8921936.1 hypothetical protein PF009_g27790 [Phytophthora fragariae]KAE9063988.1 hypothetical protein PF010_g28785 [Phytophthora fragariae]KAE9066101.1 hypothetical protein PF006_g30314 [Phytophthora fragariae]KAE9069910.1 hypothetical protein PF007_g27138 [Phytophthora fragariae]